MLRCVLELFVVAGFLTISHGNKTLFAWLPNKLFLNKVREKAKENCSFAKLRLTELKN